MKVIEKFVSINGEGLKSGELATFIRFADCNLRCPYCDTKYSYIDPCYTQETIEDIVSYVKEQNVNNVTLTGGEPLIQEGIDVLINKLSSEGFRVELETNGSVDISKYVGLKGVSFTVDYKTLSSKMTKFMILDNYKYLTKNDVVKFVCGSIEDLEDSMKTIREYNLVEKTNPFISPIWGDIEFSEIVDFLKDNNLNGVRLQLQIHKIIWDKDKRGV